MLTRRSRLQCHPRRSTPSAEAEGRGDQRLAVQCSQNRRSPAFYTGGEQFYRRPLTLTHRSRLRCHPRRSMPLAEAEGPGTHDLQRNAVKIVDPRSSLQAVSNYLSPQSTRRTRRSRRPPPDCRLRPKADTNAAADVWRCRLFLRTGRRDCGRACDSVLRAQGRFDALDQPLSLGRAPRRPEEGVDADDRQVRLHRRRQRCRGHAGQPRVLGLHGRTVGSWPLRIVDEFRKELGRDNVTDPQVEGRGRADRSEPVDESRTSPVLRRAGSKHRRRAKINPLPARPPDARFGLS
jgi:hypothetical protein